MNSYFQPPRGYHGRKARRFSFGRFSNQSGLSGEQPTDAELVNWSTGFLRPHLKPCVDQVIALDQDASAYEAMITQPALPGTKKRATWRQQFHGFAEVIRALRAIDAVPKPKLRAPQRTKLVRTHRRPEAPPIE